MYGKVARGEDLPQSKLTAELVRKMRRLHARKERLKRLLDERYGAAALAAKCSVAETTMNKVLTYATWRHVQDEPRPARRAR